MAGTRRGLITALVALGAASSFALPQKYIAVDLGAIDGTLGHLPTRLNNNGWVIGNGVFGPKQIAWLWANNVMSDLGVLPGRDTSYAGGINDGGRIIGTSGQGSAARAWLWQNGNLTQLTNFASQGVAINNLNNMVINQITGASRPGSLVIGNQFFGIPTLSPDHTAEGRLLNNNNRVAGIQYIGAPGTDMRVYDWDFDPANPTAPARDLQVLRDGDLWAEPTDLADFSPYDPAERGLTVGWTGAFGSLEQGLQNVFFPAGWVAPGPEGPIYLLPLEGDGLTEARGINELGQVVGRSGHWDNLSQRFFWNPTVWYLLPTAPYNIGFDLHSLISPNFSNIKLENVTDINNNGEIIGNYESGGRFRGVKLVPVAAPEDFIIDPLVVHAGDPATGIILLDDRAPTGGAVVNVSSDNPFAVVPPTVTVAAGQTVRQFTIQTGRPTTVQSVNITVERFGFKITTSFTINPMNLDRIEVNPNDITGGITGSGRVYALGLGSINVFLESSNPAIAQVPSVVTLTAQPNQRWTAFPIKTTVVTTNTTVTLTARYKDTVKTTTFRVVRPFLESLTLGTNQTFATVPVTAQVKLTNRALAGGQAVALSSSNPSIAQVPNQVVVPAGSFTANFTINSTLGRFNTNVIISASLGGVTRTQNLLVKNAMLDSLTSTPAVVQETGGVQVVVRLNWKAGPGGVTVTLVSSDPTNAPVPGGVFFPQGSSSQAFVISTKAVPFSRNVTITGSYLGINKATTFKLEAAELTTHTINPSTLFAGGTATGTVTLARPTYLNGGMPIQLFSSDTNVVQVPAQVIIPKFGTTATYTVNAVGVGQATVTAVQGTISIPVTVTVN